MDDASKTTSSGENGSVPSAKSESPSPRPGMETSTPHKVLTRKPSSGGSVGDRNAPRRLSQLFVPPGEEVDDDDDVQETSCLLTDDESNPSIKNIKIVPRQTEPVSRASPLPQERRPDSDVEKSHSSKHSDTVSSSNSSSDEDDHELRDFNSLDDTICSNRSAYFKHYYLGTKSGDEAKSRASTHGSSYNSLASLITERRKSIMKMKKTKKRKREDMWLLVFVIVLFLVLVIGIGLIHYFYHQHLLQLSLFKRLKYNDEKRLLEVFDNKGRAVVVSHMGTTFSQYSKPEECTEYLKYLYDHVDEEEDEISIPVDIIFNVTDFTTRRRPHEFQFDNETVCLDWAQMARVQIHRAPLRGTAKCYNVFWLAHQTSMDLQDCIAISGSKSGTWWGIGELAQGGYPLSSIDSLESEVLTTSQLDKAPWGKILRRAFMSSNGGLLTFPAHLTASVSIRDGYLCVATNASHTTNDVPLTLNYTICSSPNVSSALLYLDYLAKTPTPIRVNLSPKDELRERILERIEEPIWIPYLDSNSPNLTQDSILEYADQIISLNYSHWGHILLPEKWQLDVGHLDFDQDRFEDPKNLTELLVRKGFNLALMISPVVSTGTSAFEKGAKNGFWVQQKGSSSLPILVQDKDVVAGALTDFTNKRAADWYVSQLKELKTNYGIDRFYLTAPDSKSVSVYHQFDQDIQNPDMYLDYFLESVRGLSAPLAVEAAIIPPPLPTFVTVGSESSGWESLASLIPRILTLTMLGYPLIDAGIVGGVPDRPGNIPDDELFIRWSQVVCFLPAFQIQAIPSFYSQETKDIVSKFVRLREKIVIPRFKRTLEATLEKRTPLISPLSLLYADDAYASEVADEWILDHDLLVAPILNEGATSRKIYIPNGLWENQADGRLKRGPGWILNHHIPLGEVAYFIKRHSVDLSN